MKDTRLFKVDTKEDIIFKDDYIIINGCFAVHKDFIQLNNAEFQAKIINNQEFNYSNGNYLTGLPNVKQIIPASPSADYTLLTDTHLFTTGRCKNHTDVYFYNQCKNYFTSIDNRYYKFINDNKFLCLYDLIQSTKHGAIYQFIDKQCVLLLMPTSPTSILNSLYIFSNNAQNTLSKYEDLQQYQIGVI